MNTLFQMVMFVFVLVWFVVFPLKTPFDSSDVFFEGLYFIVAFCTLFIIRKTNIHPLIFGWNIFVLGLLVDLLDEFTSEPSLINTEIEGLLTILGFLMIGSGLYRGVQKIRDEIDQREKTEMMLRQSEEKYRLLADQTIDVIFTQDMELNLTYISPSAERLFGYKLDDMYRLGMKGLMTLDSYQTALESFQKYCYLASQTKDVAIPIVEYDYVCKDGSFFCGEIHVDFLRGGQGVLTGIQGVLRDVTVRNQTSQALKDSEKQKKMVLESTTELIAYQDKEHKIVWTNRACGESVGQRAEDLVGKYCYEIWGDKKGPCEDCPVIETLQSGTAQESVKMSPDGQIWQLRSAPIYDENEQLLGAVETALNITDKKQAEKQLQQERDYLENVFDNSADAIVIVDRHGRFVRRNKKAIELFGPDVDSQKKAFDVYASKEEMEQLLVTLREYGQVIDYEARLEKRDGTILPAALSISLLYDAQGKKAGSVSVIRDLTERKEFENRLIELSYHDSLTGLYNRSFYEEEMRRLEDDRYCPIGMILCDIDGLKFMNDTLGHEKGDELLKVAAEILKRSFRTGDIIARIGGDEFAVLLPQSNEEIVRACCQRITSELERYNTQIPELGLSLSIGCSIKHESSVGMSELFKQADDIMYKEKLQQSQSSRNATVQGLIKTMEARDYMTNGHGDRLQGYAQKLGSVLGFSDEKMYDLCLLCRFHDLGKVGIEDSVLFKQGPLTDVEYREIQRHCEIGYRIALSISDVAPIAEFILRHHEWWNGQGYPLGLRGEEIPLECRILSIVDAYDVLTNERPYQKAKSHQEAVEELRKCAGSQFDPVLVDKFIWVLENGVE
jgi:diguanylate cyclase (GGDEF)-like protein/PAS domain S-box-containing protein